MIKTERQYATTRAQLDRLREFLQDTAEPQGGVDPQFLQLERLAIESQLAELATELEAFDALRSGRAAILPLSTLEDLPRALISARIARGWTQADLAERLGVAEQQVQRYEATDYASASFARLVDIARALEVDVPGAVVTNAALVTPGRLFERLREVGLDRDLLLRRLLPPDIAATIEGAAEAISPVRAIGAANDSIRAAVARAGALVSRVLAVDTAEFFSSGPLTPAVVAGQALFKQTPTQAEREKQRRLSGESTSLGYVLYAHYLALVTLEAHKDHKVQRIPGDPNELRTLLWKQYGSAGKLSLSGVLNFAWDCGIPVLPLPDSGAFHGACWRIGGRNVVVLKQRTPSVARWIFDLLHELRHTWQHPESSDFSVVEHAADLNSEDEIDASTFAGDVMLDGRAEELADLAVREADGRVERLKGVVPRIARREGVAVDAFANYMAYRLSLQGLNWWGAANNLQSRDEPPFRIARDVFLERANLARLNPVDQEMLLRALKEVDLAA